MHFDSDIILVKRAKNKEVDMSSRAALELVGWIPDTPLKQAAEYCKYSMLL